jgi:hypothetical protein
MRGPKLRAQHHGDGGRRFRLRLPLSSPIALLHAYSCFTRNVATS